jgi:cytochrome c biogenesis protein CcmG/thiol:disulfide interchange protein DsbE
MDVCRVYLLPHLYNGNLMKQIKPSNFIFLSIVLLLSGAAWIWVSRSPAGVTTQGEIQAPQTGFTAPDFTLETFDQESYTLSDLRGKAILVNFWASWCPPCRSEMPAMQQVYEDLEQQGFVVLAVNSTFQDNLGDAITFAQVHKLSFPILLDQDGSVNAAYEVRSLPTSFFIDPQGTIQDVVVGGPMSEALLRIRAEQLLEDSP